MLLSVGDPRYPALESEAYRKPVSENKNGQYFKLGSFQVSLWKRSLYSVN